MTTGTTSTTSTTTTGTPGANGTTRNSGTARTTSATEATRTGGTTATTRTGGTSTTAGSTGPGGTGNAYLDGAFAPVHEELTVTDLRVTGELPDHLDGRYLRVGPNPVVDPDPATYMWFLGEGMVHGLRLRDGRAEWYRNRWVRSANVSRLLGEKRREGARRAGIDFPANTNIIGHAGRTLALVEAGATCYELTEQLETVGPTDFAGTMHSGYTAHPKLDADTGELHSVSYSGFRGNHLRYDVIGTDGRVRHTADFEVTGQPMIHDFALTERHVVVWDLPVTADLSTLGRIPGLLSRLAGNRPAPRSLESLLMWASRSGRIPASATPQPFRWNPDYPARVGVFRRDGDASDIRWYSVGPCFVFHALNAYDDADGTIVVDVVRYPKLFDTVVDGPNDGLSTLDRWRVDPQAGTLAEERLDDRPQEFPRVDERLVGRRHRYGYVLQVGSPASAVDPTDVLLRHDVETGRTQTRSFGPAARVSEFVFVPSEPDAAEDDGVLMGFVLDQAADTSDLVLLDAATLEDVARVHLPARVPAGLHGNWVPT